MQQTNIIGKLLIVVTVACFSQTTEAQTISTFAGNGYSNYGGDGGRATSAALFFPYGAVLDAVGNVYIADTYNNRIRKVSTNGIITTFAGNGNIGYSGDGGAATSAELNHPYAVALDANGNLYIVSNSCRVRKVGTNGIITTFAGNGYNGYSGDGGLATSAELSYPNGVAVDASGNVYIADYNRIRKVGTNGIITTFAGNGMQGYSGDGGAATSAELDPVGVAVDKSGNLYIADYGNNVIRKVGTNGIIITFAGNGTGGYSGDGGAATSAELNNPARLAVDASDNVYIADEGNNRIRKVGTNGIITTFAGNGTGGYSGDGGAATSAELYSPRAVAVDVSGSVYIADAGNNRLRKVGTNGIITTFAGDEYFVHGGDEGPATSAELYSPNGAAVDTSGNVYIADAYNNRIRKVGTNGIITTFAGNGTGGYGGNSGAGTSAELNYPTGLAFDISGNVYIADNGNNVIRKVGTNGIITTFAGNGTSGYGGNGGAATSAALNYPTALAVDISGNVYIADNGNNVIRKVGTNGIITTFAGNGKAGYSGDGGAAASAELNLPIGVALDISGNVYIADYGNSVIRKVGRNGIITTFVGNGTAGYGGNGGAATSAELNYPTGLAVDISGNMYIADNGNNVIRKVGRNGIITTFAGNGKAGYSGDGGAAASAEFDSPSGVAVDAMGNVYIPDQGNNRIRKVTVNGSLPLTLLSFTGETQHNTNVLSWQTTQEINTQSFTVQRSGDGANFTAIGSVPAADAPGTNNYSLTDAKPLVGANYYRLKMFDKDGAFTYSGVVELNNSDASFALKVYPNPAASSATLSFNSLTAGKYAVTITGSDGKTIKRIAGTAVTGTNTQQLDISGLAAGVYMVTFVSADGTHNLKLVKQ